VLDTVLDTIASYKENIEALKGKIKKALFYPAIVIAVAIIVSAILLIFVVPQFKDTFELRRRPAGLHPDDRLGPPTSWWPIGGPCC
jgi:type II secretory pathway component PulF